jgi:hypothetical protein
MASEPLPGTKTPPFESVGMSTARSGAYFRSWVTTTRLAQTADATFASVCSLR